MKSTIFAGAALVAVANAQSGPWGQCGGNNWTGSKTCVAGYTCTLNNEWYSQCLPGGNPPAVTTTVVRTTTRTTAAATTVRTTTTRGVTTARTTTTAVAPTTTKPATSNPTGWLWLGVNESGAEFGEKVLPGTYGEHFIFPDANAMGTLINQGYNMFRVAFKMERLAQGSITNNFNAAYAQNLTNTINAITSRGATAVLDPHNYGRYNDVVVTDAAAFGVFWKNLATLFKDNNKVIFDTNNEYWGMPQANVLALNQAAINAIRSTGATQWIFVEGNNWSGAWSWVDINDSMKQLTDPENKLIYEMHQYLDADSSGTNENCVSTTIGVERVVAATKWLRDNGKIGVLGEFAGGPNPTCQAAVKGLLDYLKTNSDVWKGALWWGGGPWWDKYMFSFEPPSGTGYTNYNQLLLNYKP